MKKLTEQEQKELKVLNENLKKHEESLKEKEGKFEGFVKPLTEVVEKHREWTNDEKAQMARMMFHRAEKDLDEHFNNMIERAKILVQDLERQKVYYFTGRKADRFQYALDEVNNCFSNYRMSDAARKLAKFEKADALLKVFKGEKVNLW